MSVYFVCSYTQKYFLVCSVLFNAPQFWVDFFFFSQQALCKIKKYISSVFNQTHNHAITAQSDKPWIINWTVNRPISDLTCKSVSNIWDTFRINSVISLFPKAGCIMFVCSSSLVFKLGADISIRLKIQRLREIWRPHQSSSICATTQTE